MLTEILDKVGLQSILVGLFAFICVYYLFIKKKYKLPPGPFALPLIGNYGVYMSKRIHREISKVAQKYGPICTVNIGPQTWVILNDIDSVMEAMVTKKADFADRPKFHSMDVMTDNGKDIIFAQYSPRWQLHRKIANRGIRQFIQGEHLEAMVTDTMNLVMDAMEAENGKFDPKDLIDQTTYIMLFKICFGKKCGLKDTDVMFIKGMNEKAQEDYGNGLIEDLIPFMKNIYVTEKYKKVMKVINDYKEYFWKQFNEHKETFDSNNIRDFTDSLLLAREEAEREEDASKMERLSDIYLVQTTLDIFSAGVDTSRMTLSWFVLFMAGLPEIQKKCHEEIDKAVGKDRTPELSDRENLQYVEACLYESMRLGSVAALGVPHAAACDSTIGGYEIPKGTAVVINHYALHRDPKYWPDVEKFKPERYLNSDGKIVGKPDSWLPFSAGKRSCLGEPVAKPELALICACLLHRLSIKLPPGVTPNFEEAPVPNLFVPEKYEIIVERRLP